MTPAELTFGESIRVPGEFFTPPDRNTVAPELVENLRAHFRKLTPTTMSIHGMRATFVYKDLATCSHVLVRNDQVRQSFSSPYDGPYRIVSKHTKHFVLLMPPPKVARRFNRLVETSISIDRLKPVYSLPDDVPESSQQQQQQQQQQQSKPAAVNDSPQPTTSTGTTTSTRNKRAKKAVRFARNNQVREFSD
ncbi:uncharacterized protein LOC107044643 [Diachasma alloeum]|uniref:uncharacterized protein LOC107044643 n=1 Tax=Diachasma alloeum TaxID=454923 RepID=UPI0007381BCA|nr:uncharacterized protein LOC107044643 [Diachasma alloeum]